MNEAETKVKAKEVEHMQDQLEKSLLLIEQQDTKAKEYQDKIKILESRIVELEDREVQYHEEITDLKKANNEY